MLLPLLICNVFAQHYCINQLPSSSQCPLGYDPVTSIEEFYNLYNPENSDNRLYIINDMSSPIYIDMFHFIGANISMEGNTDSVIYMNFCGISNNNRIKSFSAENISIWISKSDDYIVISDCHLINVTFHNVSCGFAAYKLDSDFYSLQFFRTVWVFDAVFNSIGHGSILKRDFDIYCSDSGSNAIRILGFPNQSQVSLEQNTISLKLFSNYVTFYRLTNTYFVFEQFEGETGYFIYEYSFDFQIILRGNSKATYYSQNSISVATINCYENQQITISSHFRGIINVYSGKTILKATQQNLNINKLAAYNQSEICFAIGITIQQLLIQNSPVFTTIRNDIGVNIGEINLFKAFEPGYFDGNINLNVRQINCIDSTFRINRASNNYPIVFEYTMEDVIPRDKGVFLNATSIELRIIFTGHRPSIQEAQLLVDRPCIIIEGPELIIPQSFVYGSPYSVIPGFNPGQNSLEIVSPSSGKMGIRLVSNPMVENLKICISEIGYWCYYSYLYFNHENISKISSAIASNTKIIDVIVMTNMSYYACFDCSTRNISLSIVGYNESVLSMIKITSNTRNTISSLDLQKGCFLIDYSNVIDIPFIKIRKGSYIQNQLQVTGNSEIYFASIPQVKATMLRVLFDQTMRIKYIASGLYLSNNNDCSIVVPSEYQYGNTKFVFPDRMSLFIDNDGGKVFPIEPIFGNYGPTLVISDSLSNNDKPVLNLTSDGVLVINTTSNRINVLVNTKSVEFIINPSNSLVLDVNTLHKTNLRVLSQKHVIVNGIVESDSVLTGSHTVISNLSIGSHSSLTLDGVSTNPTVDLAKGTTLSISSDQISGNSFIIHSTINNYSSLLTIRDYDSVTLPKSISMNWEMPDSVRSTLVNNQEFSIRFIGFNPPRRVPADFLNKIQIYPTSMKHGSFNLNAKLVNSEIYSQIRLVITAVSTSSNSPIPSIIIIIILGVIAGAAYHFFHKKEYDEKYESLI